jgi:hypothetical protein
LTTIQICYTLYIIYALATPLHESRYTKPHLEHCNTPPVQAPATALLLPQLHPYRNSYRNSYRNIYQCTYFLLLLLLADGILVLFVV